VSPGDSAAAREYHERTKHSLARLRAHPHALDWEIQPLAFKIYDTLEPIALPRELPPIDVPALDAIATVEPPVAGPAIPDLVALTQLLYYGGGITKRKRYPGGEIFFRAPACTGALYHIDLYVVCGELPGVAAGVYHFGPQDRGLRRLRAGDFRGILIDATAAEPAVARAPAVLVCTSTYWRNAWKYQARTYRHCFWDCGTLLANVLAVAAARELPARVVAGFVDDTVNRLLDLDTTREVALALVPVGRVDGGAPGPAPEVTQLGLTTVPLSAREVDYPAIRAMHTASSLATPAEVAAWRGRPSAAPSPARAGDALPLQPLPPPAAARDPIDRVILRRASTRAFARAPLDPGVFSTMLDRATRGVPADYLDPPGGTLNELYLIVNAVDGLAPGAYVFRRESGSLECLRTGDLRREAGHLGLGQTLPADASADVFMLADLDPILERLGNRGYRAAELEAGIIGGKLYLAAYAQRLGATGLTFFDDDVTGFFSPHAAGKSVMFLVALGRPLRPARARASSS
jgi:SagB-type dehydrogenase family enzyme